MAACDPVDELKQAYRDRLSELVAMGVPKKRIADAAGVSLGQPGKWLAGTSMPNATSRRRLAERWPAIFAYERVAPAWLSYLYPEVLTDGSVPALDVAIGAAELYDAAVDAILADPVKARDREILHVGMHCDVPGGDATSSDPFFDGNDRRGNIRFRDALIKRSIDDRWTIKSIVATDDIERLDGMIYSMTAQLSGPRTEVRAYRFAPPPLLNSLIVARRDASVAYDDPRSGKPAQSIWFHSDRVVEWMRSYFHHAFGEAQYRLRTTKQLREDEFDRMRHDIVASSSGRPP
jgi:hypothetical protein